MDSVRRLEVSKPRHRGRTGALIGAGFGLAAVSMAGSADPCQPECIGSGEYLAASAFAAALTGGIGYWIGKKIRQDEWSDAPVGDLKVSVQPLKKGGRLAVAFSF